MNRCTPFAFTIIFSWALLFNSATQAQSVSVDSLLVRALATDQLLPMLIDSAIKYSPEVRRIGSTEDYAAANLRINKNIIYSAVSMVSSYNYGTNISALTNPGSTVGGNNFTTSQNSFYNVGIGLQLPVTHLINRKSIIKAGQSQVSMATAEKDQAALIIRQEVIRLYQDFKLSQKLVTISSRNKQGAQINNSMAEKDFLNGQISIDQVSRVLDIYNKSTIEFETNVNRFQMMYMQLEAYTNTNLSTLIMQVK